MQQIQQSEATAAQRRIFFQLVDATDGISAETAQTGTGFLSKNGATTAATSGSLVELSATNMPGRYYIELTAAELDTLGILELRFKASATAEMAARAQIVPFDPYDAVRMGLTALPNANAEAAGGLYTRGSGAGQINQAANGMVDTNPVRLNNVAQSLLDLKDFADDGYDPATNKLTGLLLADTVTTVSGAVGSVTGAVGSVTGNIGGNVVGTVASVTGNVDGNVTGSVGSVLGSVASVTADVGITQAAADKVFGSSGATLAELSQGVPPATPRPDQAFMLMYMAMRNKLDVPTVATDALEIHNDAGTRITQKLLTDDGTDYSEAKMTSGA